MNDIMSQLKVVAVTKHNYTLETGEVYEHMFDIDENITVEEFQKMLDKRINNSKNTPRPTKESFREICEVLNEPRPYRSSDSKKQHFIPDL